MAVRELESSNQEVVSGSNSGEIQCSDSMNSFYAELLGDDALACTHTHTCNPPGPDSSHTHTCFHVHTKIVAAPNDENGATNDDCAESVVQKGRKRPLGNREAVRKYREKKKAHTVSLEDEIVRLRALNQELLKRLQRQADLEREVARLKFLLLDIRGRIEGAIGSFPYQKPVQNGVNPSLPGAYAVNPCNAPCIVPCNDQIYCPRLRTEGTNGGGLAFDDCGISRRDFRNLNCFANLSSGLGEVPACGMGICPSVVNDRNEAMGTS
ncbi:Basic leucine zipper 19-like protein [Drosera capensis]